MVLFMHIAVGLIASLGSVLADGNDGVSKSNRSKVVVSFCELRGHNIMVIAL